MSVRPDVALVPGAALRPRVPVPPLVVVVVAVLVARGATGAEKFLAVARAATEEARGRVSAGAAEGPRRRRCTRYPASVSTGAGEAPRVPATSTPRRAEGRARVSPWRLWTSGPGGTSLSGAAQLVSRGLSLGPFGGAGAGRGSGLGSGLGGTERAGDAGAGAGKGEG